MQVAKLTGHTSRVLYLVSNGGIGIWVCIIISLSLPSSLPSLSFSLLAQSMSPDGQSVVTGAGDETLRFWNVFSKSKSFKEPNSPLDMASFIR